MQDTTNNAKIAPPPKRKGQVSPPVRGRSSLQWAASAGTPDRIELFNQEHRRLPWL